MAAVAREKLAELRVSIPVIRILGDQLPQEQESFVGVPFDDAGISGLDEKPLLFGGPGRIGLGFLQGVVAGGIVEKRYGCLRHGVVGEGERGVEGDGFFCEFSGVRVKEIIVSFARPQIIIVGLHGARGEVDDLPARRLDLEGRGRDAAADRPADLVDLGFEDAGDTVPLGRGTFKDMFVGGVQNLDVRGERLSRLDKAPQNDGLDALLPADFEARLLVEDRRPVPPGIAEEVFHPLPGRDPQALRLL